MRTRRFKALNGSKGKYPKIVEKIAIYDEHDKMIDCAKILCDPKEFGGKEYYHPSNPNDSFGLFINKPKDALECIKNGFGDGFTVHKIFGFNNEDVVRFIDREFGENIRRKTIDGWKNTKFGYALKFSWLSSFSDGSKVCKDNSLASYNTKPEDILTFETEEDAKKYAIEIEKTATEYYNEYKNLKLTDDEVYNYEHIHKPFFKKIKGEKEHGWESIYYRTFYGINESNEKGKLQYKLEPIQVVLS